MKFKAIKSLIPFYNYKVFRKNFQLFLEILPKNDNIGCSKTFEWQCTSHNGQNFCLSFFF